LTWLLVCCVLQVRSFIDDAYKRTVGLLRERKDLVDKMAQVGGVAAVWMRHMRGKGWQRGAAYKQHAQMVVVIQ
jgi:hypothetical protein